MKINLVLSICAFVTVGFISGCDEEESEKQYDVKGLVQKGPFVIGTTTAIAELSASLDQTGKVFTTEIVDNSGLFEISGISLASNYVQLAANGYYFDEVKGDISVTTLTLNGIADVTSLSTINLNVLTHLEKPRVEYLVDNGTGFLTAKETAQSEILAAFGMSPGDIDNSESLDIAFDNTGGAVLLAISVILQGERSVGELTELLATITSDMREDGALDNDIVMNSLRASAKELDLPSIRTNLQARYNEIGSSALIPAFEEYVNSFLSFTGSAPTCLTFAPVAVTESSATLNGHVNANSLSTAVSFEYGLTTTYGSSISAMPGTVAGFSGLHVTGQVTGLLAGKTYHVRTKGENSKGITYGEDMTFSTLGGLAMVSTATASNVHPTGATLNGTVNPNYLPTTVTFEYGLTTSYGSSIAIDQGALTGNSNVSVTATIADLTQGQTYHFRTKAQNEAGTSVGNDFTFITYTTIGSPFQGGLLAYVLKPGDSGYDANNIHGFIVSTDDLGKYDWVYYEVTPPNTNVLDKAIGAGIPNTNRLATFLYANAAKACYNLVLNGYDDWFLPSPEELAVLNPNSSLLGLKTGASDIYWSSSEYPPGGFIVKPSGFAYGYSYYNGSSTITLKWTSQWVRPMRAF